MNINNLTVNLILLWIRIQMSVQVVLGMLMSSAC